RARQRNRYFELRGDEMHWGAKMTKLDWLRAALAGGAAAMALATSASATEFNIPRGDLKTALDSYAHQAGVQLMYPDDEMTNAHTAGVHGELTAEVALSRILSGTGFATRQVSGAIAIVRSDDLQQAPRQKPVELAWAEPAHAA